MKKLFLLVLVLVSFASHAGEVMVLDQNLPYMNSFESFVNTKFFMDKTTNEGFVKVAVSEMEYIYTGNGHRDPWGNWTPETTRIAVPRLVFQDMVKVDGLELMDDKVVYHGEEGDVLCGTMGTSRVFKVPTLYLNGNCRLTDKIEHTITGSRVRVFLKTK